MGFEELLGVNPWTALFTLANTVALFLVLKKFLFKPVLKMIEDRQQEIDGMYTQAGQAQANAQAMETEYRQKLSDAQATGERIVKEAVARGQSREEDILRQAARQGRRRHCAGKVQGRQRCEKRDFRSGSVHRRKGCGA